jgi:hypothetical protein
MPALTRLLTPATVVASVLAVALPATASAASSTTITACVKTRTGVFKILTAKQAKKKCPKGSKKVTWSVKGKNGKNGTNGKNGASGKNGTDGASGAAGASSVVPVHDSAGNLLGQYAGTVAPAFAIAIARTVYNVLGPDGGLYQYYADGRLVPSVLSFEATPLFRDSACAGTAYLTSGQPGDALLSGVSDASRWVYRPIDSADPSTPQFGPARAWKFTGATMTVPPMAGTFYVQDPSGVCIAADDAAVAAFAGATLPVLKSVPAPPDGVGTIVVG